MKELPDKFHKPILEERELLSRPNKPGSFIIEGLVEQGATIIISGPPGSGKSFFALSIANSAVRGVDLAHWKVEHLARTLIIDGELPTRDLRERMLQLNFMAGSSMNMNSAPLYFYSDAHCYEIGLPQINLTLQTQREFITNEIRDKEIGLVIIDNLAALCPGVDENLKVDFDPINLWLRQLRYDNISVVIVHHTNKTGGQRGTTSHIDHVNLDIILERPKGYSFENDGCKFIINIKKDRSFLMRGQKKVLLQLQETQWENLHFVRIPLEQTPTFKPQKKLTPAQDFFIKNPAATTQEAEKAGIKKASFSRAKRKYGASG